MSPAYPDKYELLRVRERDTFLHRTPHSYPGEHRAVISTKIL